jgi:nucleotide-binding universal stress UspA family protein
VHLAALWRVSVRGIFVEDERLLHAATLPGVREVHSAVRRPQRFDRSHVQDHWRRAAEYMKQALEQAARHARVTATLDVVRGKVAPKVLQAATERDVLVLGKTSTDSSRRRLGSTARRVLSETPASVLVLRHLAAPSRPIVTYFDSTDAAAAALRMALKAARDTPNLPVRVLLPSGSAAERREHRERMRKLCREADPWVQTRTLRPVETRRLASALENESGRLVVVPDHVLPASPAALNDFLYTIDRPLLVVRPPARDEVAPSAPSASEASTTARPPGVRIALAPHDVPHVTPLELLEDFADASPNWQYLDDASRHYADVKGVPACVLRHRIAQRNAFVDVAFAAAVPDALSNLELVLLDAHDVSLDEAAWRSVINTLLEDLRAYLEARPGHASLRVEVTEPPASDATTST